MKKFSPVPAGIFYFSQISLALRNHTEKWETGNSLVSYVICDFSATFQLVIFGGMNDQKDFSDVCIFQTRAALKHLPPEMTGNQL